MHHKNMDMIFIQDSIDYAVIAFNEFSNGLVFQLW